MKKLWIGLVVSALVLSAGPALAGSTVRASMVVKGHIVIGTGGGIYPLQQSLQLLTPLGGNASGS